nr:hypothetical protein Iba_chr09cCG10600 [Ipomoea batatas]
MEYLLYGLYVTNRTEKARPHPKPYGGRRTEIVREKGKAEEEQLSEAGDREQWSGLVKSRSRSQEQRNRGVTVSSWREAEAENGVSGLCGSPVVPLWFVDWSGIVEIGEAVEYLRSQAEKERAKE